MRRIINIKREYIIVSGNYSPRGQGGSEQVQIEYKTCNITIIDSYDEPCSGDQQSTDQELNLEPVAPFRNALFFISNRDEGDIELGTIYRHSLVTGSTGKFLPPHPRVNYGSPAVSPDGTRIAFSRNERICIWDGGTASPDCPQQGAEPAWSPDSRFLAFVRLNKNEYKSIVLLDVAQNTTRVLVDTPNANNTSPTWSGDGQTIAFVSDRDGNNEIYTVAVNDLANVRNISNHPQDDITPHWSSARDEIVFTSNRTGPFAIHRIRNPLEQTPIVELLPELRDNTSNFYAPRWSPDGQRLAFETFINGKTQVVVINIGDSRPLLTPLWDEAETNYGVPAWTP
ncbi:hypothetical protein HC928_00840 [bacterium]|nr:hypothetical protein [bacterium]